jgi:hypothetical protein
MDKLRCAFRRPHFPIICKIGTELVCGDTLQQFERRLKKFDVIAEETFPLVDATGEGWVLVPKFSAISPSLLTTAGRRAASSRCLTRVRMQSAPA